MHDAPMMSRAGLDRLSSAEQRERVKVLRAQVRRRALGDTVLVLAAAVLVSVLASTAEDAMLLAIGTISLGILAFVIRRSHDLERLERAARWREEALAGRGISLAQWHQGAPLPAWTERVL